MCRPYLEGCMVQLKYDLLPVEGVVQLVNCLHAKLKVARILSIYHIKFFQYFQQKQFNGAE